MKVFFRLLKVAVLTIVISGAVFFLVPIKIEKVAIPCIMAPCPEERRVITLSSLYEESKDGIRRHDARNAYFDNLYK